MKVAPFNEDGNVSDQRPSPYTHFCSEPDYLAPYPGAEFEVLAQQRKPRSILRTELNLEEIGDLLAQLPNAGCTAFIMHNVMGLGFADIGWALGVSEQQANIVYLCAKTLLEGILSRTTAPAQELEPENFFN